MHLARSLCILAATVPFLLAACGGSEAAPTATATADGETRAGGVLPAVAALAAAIFAGFPEPGETGAKKAELDSVQTAFDALRVEAGVMSLLANGGPQASAVHVWTGLPLNEDGKPIMVGGAATDLKAYLRMVGRAGDETTYAYCWDSAGRVWQWERGQMCVYVEQYT